MSKKYFSVNELNLKVEYKISILKSFLVKYLMGNKNRKIFSKNKHGKSRKYFPVKYFIKKIDSKNNKNISK